MLEAALHRARGLGRRVRRRLRKYMADETPAPAPRSDVYVAKYVTKEEIPGTLVDREGLRQFRNRHKGERCFIVGNGPSLNQTDLSMLDNEVTFGVNGIFYKTDELGFKPTYYVVEDSHVVDDNLERIRDFRTTHRFFPSEYRTKLGELPDTSYFLMNRGFYTTNSPNFHIPRFSADAADRIYCGQTVTYMNFQLAYYMGFTKVYLIGVDFSYVIPESAVVEGKSITSTDDDPNHFHPEYFGKGKKWHDPQLDEVIKGYQFARLVFEWDGRAIYNATKGGRLEVYPRVDYDELFKG